MARAFNFSAGPATLPLEVLQQIQNDLVDYKGTGMSVMEMSHRGKDYPAIHAEAKANFKELCGIGDDYEVVFIQGGGSQQFAMIPMNFLPAGATADYANQGTWSGKALKEAKIVAALRGANVNTVADCAKDIPTRMPADGEWKFSDNAVYTHLCTNETISGAQLKKIPEVKGPLFADMSSDILGIDRDFTKFDLFYAGMAVVAIRKELAAKHGDEQSLVGQLLTETSLHAHPPAAQHKGTGHQMAETQQALRLYPLISYDAHQRRHENRHDALNGIEPGNLTAQACHAQIVSHTRQIGSPDGKLQEVHYCKS